MFARRGLFPEGESLWFLPQLVGLARAKEWMISGRVFDAEEAARAGLVTSVHPPGELWQAAETLALDIAANVAPGSAAVIRRGLMAMAARGNPEATFAIDRQTILYAFTSPDMIEGVNSFPGKRAPQFTGSAHEAVSHFPWLRFERISSPRPDRLGTLPTRAEAQVSPFRTLVCSVSSARGVEHRLAQGVGDVAARAASGSDPLRVGLPRCGVQLCLRRVEILLCDIDVRHLSVNSRKVGRR